MTDQMLTVKCMTTSIYSIGIFFKLQSKYKYSEDLQYNQYKIEKKCGYNINRDLSIICE